MKKTLFLLLALVAISHRRAEADERLDYPTYVFASRIDGDDLSILYIGCQRITRDTVECARTKIRITADERGLCEVGFPLSDTITFMRMSDDAWVYERPSAHCSHQNAFLAIFWLPAFGAWTYGEIDYPQCETSTRLWIPTRRGSTSTDALFCSMRQPTPL